MTTQLATNGMQTQFEQFLGRQSEEAWAATLTILLRSIHEVDKNATQIWFAFSPLSLFTALHQAEDKDPLVKQLLMQGHYELKDQIDSSHTFLYGHRYWPQVKKAVEAFAVNFNAGSIEVDCNAAGTTQLSDQILKVARDVAQTLKVHESLLVGITAVVFMTVRQAGM